MSGEDTQHLTDFEQGPERVGPRPCAECGGSGRACRRCDGTGYMPSPDITATPEEQGTPSPGGGNRDVAAVVIGRSPSATARYVSRRLPMPDVTPKTESGRALLAEVQWPALNHFDWGSRVLAIEQEAASVAVAEVLDRLASAMNEVYTYEDRDNDQPTLRFVDDIEGFWRPFSEKVRALIASERKP